MFHYTLFQIRKIRTRYHAKSMTCPNPPAANPASTVKLGLMAQSQQKNIRVTAEQWARIEEAARERQVSPNQLVVELAIEALDRREWPSTEAEIKVARASLFAAQILARGLIADGREQEVQEIRDFISGIVRDPDAKLST